jgi:hypothetical protein
VTCDRGPEPSEALLILTNLEALRPGTWKGVLITDNRPLYKIAFEIKIVRAAEIFGLL